MVFLQPIFLYGLVLLAVPIVIHFLNLRRSKTVFFSSLRFIEEVKSTYRKRNRITDLLLLLLRILTIACLVLAFAQPVVRTAQTNSTSRIPVVGIYIDNSPSMQLTDEGSSLLDLARKKAAGVVAGFPPDSRFLLLSNGSPADMPGIADRESVVRQINSIQPASDAFTLEEILQYFKQGLADPAYRLSSILLFSDFQESLFNRALTKDSSGIRVYPVPLEAAGTANISIDSCWLADPVTLAGHDNQLIVKVDNRSDQAYEDFPVRLILNDTLRNQVTAKLPAHGIAEVPLDFHPNTRGWQSGSVQISDFPVTFDNTLFFSFRIEPDIPVLLLFDEKENPYLKNAFGNDPYFRFESFRQKGFPRSDFNDYGLVIISGIKNPDNSLIYKAREFIRAGGTVWFLPEMDGDLNGYNAFLGSVDAPHLGDPVGFRVESRIPPEQQKWLEEVVVNVDKRLRLPYFNQSFKLTATNNRTDLLRSANGDLLVSRFPWGKGSLVLTAFPLDDQVTDLMYHPLFIPLCYRIATLSRNAPALYQVNGQNKPVSIVLPLSGERQAIRLKSQATGFETVPVQQPGFGPEIIVYPGHLPSAGQYLAITGRDTVADIAFNYSRSESDLRFVPDSVIRDRLSQSGWQVLMNKNSSDLQNPQEIAGSLTQEKLWYYFLIIALMSLLAESFVMIRKK